MDAIEVALWKCMEHICPQSITRQTSVYLGAPKLTGLDHCDGSSIYINGCPERERCDHITDLILRNRQWEN